MRGRLSGVCLVVAGIVGSSLTGVSGCGTSSPSAGPSDAGDGGSVGDVVVAEDAPADAAAGNPLCPNGVSAPYPTAGTAVTLLGTLPDMTFDGLDTGGSVKKVSLHDYFEPCAAKSRLLVVRVSAGWCGTCRWHAAHTGELGKLDVGARLELLDLLVASEDNTPPSADDLLAWRKRIDAPGSLGLDPAFQLSPLNAGVRFPIPLIALVDTRTMVVRNYLNDPDPDILALRIHQELAILDKAPFPTPTPSQKFDGRFTRNVWDMIHDMTLPTTPPANPTNAHADDAAAAALGKQLFSDVTLSPSGTVACATCHSPAKFFQDGLPQSIGVATVDRNAPSILLAAHQRWQFWDGRADSLWMQAVGPPEAAKEIASSRLFIAHALFDRYNAPYTAIFGALPALADTTRFPPSGKPGDASWLGMASTDQQAVTRIYSNMGKAIEAFERTLRVKPNALDAYIAGDMTALTDVQKEGLRNYFVAGCAQCHYGPRLTDDAFHAVRFPTGRQDGQADRGRIDGIPKLLASEFNENGAQSDWQMGMHNLPLLKADPSTLGSFKTPTLRGIATTAPYGHGGTLATLADVAKNYSTSGLDPTSALAVGTSEPWLVKFDNPTRDALPAFLQVLTADVGP